MKALLFAASGAAAQQFSLDLLGNQRQASSHHLDEHPVRQEIVDQIKKKTNKWEPMEVADNHMALIPKD